MTDDDIKKRLEDVEKELFRVKSLYEKALFYKKIDPEVSLGQARKSAEAICKQIYIAEGYEDRGKPAVKMMLNDLVQVLTRNNVLPQHIIISLNTIQAFGNFGVHDQGENSHFINEQYIKPCLSALSNVVDWYFNEYFKTGDLNSCSNTSMHSHADFTKPESRHQSIEQIYKLSGVQIRDLFHFFKDTISVFSRSSSKFRLHFLRYDETSRIVSMCVQDQVYEDKDFEIGLSDGIDLDIIICHAIEKGKLVYRDLKEDHYVLYEDSSIPEKLSSVMAFPIRNKNKQIIGVVALDSKKKIVDLGIDDDDIEDLFIKLCSIVENLIMNIEDIYE